MTTEPRSRVVETFASLDTLGKKWSKKTILSFLHLVCNLLSFLAERSDEVRDRLEHVERCVDAYGSFNAQIQAIEAKIGALSEKKQKPPFKQVADIAIRQTNIVERLDDISGDISILTKSGRTVSTRVREHDDNLADIEGRLSGVESRLDDVVSESHMIHSAVDPDTMNARIDIMGDRIEALIGLLDRQGSSLLRIAPEIDRQEHLITAARLARPHRHAADSPT